ncbi:MAG: hypothetical protein M1838_004946 [Thelocarpon superellum]|nr:MAG: hypothetical protein M1838_004946 [Thelocarpon superellum]
MQNAFYQGQYSKVVDFDAASLSAENALPARILSLRAKVAAGHAKEVIGEVTGEEDVPDLAAVKAYAQHATGDIASATRAMEQLSASSSDNATVQILGGTVLQAEGKSEEALALLGKHQGNLEAVALVVQIHLEQNRTDLALKEVSAARRWAQDSMLINLAESWVGLRVGGERYQQAFYVFEELAQAVATTSNRTLVGQAVAELHLGRLPEAEAALQQALEREPKDADVIANLVVLSGCAGKDTDELLSSLRSAASSHSLLRDVSAKSGHFDTAAAKYSARVTG